MAVARYEIKGKYDNKAVSQAQISLAKLQKQVSSVAGSIQGFVISKVMQVGAAAIRGATDAFKEQEMQLARLNNAVKTNANLSSGALSRLKAEADKLTKGGASIFSGEEITKNQAILSSLKLNEKQINSVMKAATNMASAGIMPLDQAVKTLSKTYTGNSGKLKELNPAIANLTETQLKNGEAVAIVAAQYKGFNEAMANTEAGKARQFVNTFDDLKKVVGDIVLNVKNIAFGHLLGPLRSITKWFTENKDKIINFFRYLPEVVFETGVFVRDILKKAFSWDFLWKYLKVAFNFCWVFIKNFFKSYLAYVNVVSTVIWEPLKYGFELIMYGIKQVFYGVVNYFIDKINFLINQVNRVSKVLGFKELKSLDAIGKEDNKKPENNIGKNIKKSLDDAIKIWTDSGKDIATTWVSSMKEIGAEFKDEFEKFTNNINKIIGRPSPKNGEQAEGGEGSGTNEDQTDAAPAKQKQSENASVWRGLLDSVKQAGGAMGWIADVAERAAQSGNPLVIVVELLKIMLEGLIDVIAPIVDSILGPLFGILRVIGKFLGFALIPLLRVLELVIRPIIKAFVFLYNNVFVPIGNGLIFVFNLIYNAFATFINGISTLVRIITFGAVNLGTVSYKNLNEGRLEKIDDRDVAMEGRAALKRQGSSAAHNASSGTGAAVAAKPTEINIHFNHSFVNGDAREIALRLRAEIKEAEKMGY